MNGRPDRFRTIWPWLGMALYGIPLVAIGLVIGDPLTSALAIGSNAGILYGYYAVPAFKSRADEALKDRGDRHV